MEIKLPTLSGESEFLTAIEVLSKDPCINMGDVKCIAKKIAIKASDLLGINRVNSWILRDDTSIFDCIAAYDAEQKIFYKEYPIQIGDYKSYFLALRKDSLLVTSDVSIDSIYHDLNEEYLKPKGIFSLMHVAVRPECSISGVICFEQTNERREWTLGEQQFALALGQILAITLENKRKNSVKNELEKNLQEKDVIIGEIALRVKKNLHIISQMIVRERECMDKNKRVSGVNEMLDGFLSQIDALKNIQDSIFKYNRYREINIQLLLDDIISKSEQQYVDGKISVKKRIDEVKMNVNEAISVGLIINDVLRHHFINLKKGVAGDLRIYLEKLHTGLISVTMTEKIDGGKNGEGSFGSICMHFINDLAHEIQAKVARYSNKTENSIILNFKA